MKNFEEQLMAEIERLKKHRDDDQILIASLTKQLEEAKDHFEHRKRQWVLDLTEAHNRYDELLDEVNRLRNMM